MATELRKTLVEDAQRMEDAACDLITERRISQTYILYWVCVAVLHVITWILRKEDSHA